MFSITKKRIFILLITAFFVTTSIWADIPDKVIEADSKTLINAIKEEDIQTVHTLIQPYVKDPVAAYKLIFTYNTDDFWKSFPFRSHLSICIFQMLLEYGFFVPLPNPNKKDLTVYYYDDESGARVNYYLMNMALAYTPPEVTLLYLTYGANTNFYNDQYRSYFDFTATLRINTYHTQTINFSGGKTPLTNIHPPVNRRWQPTDAFIKKNREGIVLFEPGKTNELALSLTKPTTQDIIITVQRLLDADPKTNTCADPNAYIFTQADLDGMTAIHYVLKAGLNKLSPTYEQTYQIVNTLINGGKKNNSWITINKPSSLKRIYPLMTVLEYINDDRLVAVSDGNTVTNKPMIVALLELLMPLGADALAKDLTGQSTLDYLNALKNSNTSRKTQIDLAIRNIINGMTLYSPNQLVIASLEGFTLTSVSLKKNNENVSTSTTTGTKLNNFNAQTYVELPDDAKPTMKTLINLLQKCSNFNDIERNFGTILEQYLALAGNLMQKDSTGKTLFDYAQRIPDAVEYLNDYKDMLDSLEPTVSIDVSFNMLKYLLQANDWNAESMPFEQFKLLLVKYLTQFPPTTEYYLDPTKVGQFVLVPQTRWAMVDAAFGKNPQLPTEVYPSDTGGSSFVTEGIHAIDKDFKFSLLCYALMPLKGPINIDIIKLLVEKGSFIDKFFGVCAIKPEQTNYFPYLSNTVYQENFRKLAAALDPKSVVAVPYNSWGKDKVTKATIPNRYFNCFSRLTPLGLAIFAQSPEVVKYLISMGANKNAYDDRNAHACGIPDDQFDAPIGKVKELFSPMGIAKIVGNKQIMDIMNASSPT